MNKTTHYQLNQWDGEDRIMRPDFNRDNSIIDQALHDNAQATAAEEAARKSAVTAEANARSQQDTAIRGELATAVAGAKSEASSALKAEQTTRANQDAAIRSEVATAVATLNSRVDAIPFVKLLDYVVTENVSQVNLDVSSIRMADYAVLYLIVKPRTSSSSPTLYLRCNSLSAESDYCSNTPYLFLLSTNSNYNETVHLITLSVPGEALLAELRTIQVNSSTSVGKSQNYSAVNKTSMTAANLQTINFVVNSSSAMLTAGSRFTLYGMKL